MLLHKKTGGVSRRCPEVRRGHCSGEELRGILRATNYPLQAEYTTIRGTLLPVHLPSPSVGFCKTHLVLYSGTLPSISQRNHLSASKSVHAANRCFCSHLHCGSNEETNCVCALTVYLYLFPFETGRGDSETERFTARYQVATIRCRVLFMHDGGSS